MKSIADAHGLGSDSRRSVAVDRHPACYLTGYMPAHAIGHGDQAGGAEERILVLSADPPGIRAGRAIELNSMPFRLRAAPRSPHGSYRTDSMRLKRRLHQSQGRSKSPPNTMAQLAISLTRYIRALTRRQVIV